MVQPTGSQTILSVSVNGVPLTVLVPRFERDLAGRKLWLSFPPEHVRFFDTGTGQRLVPASLAPASAA